jgi:cytochrome c-type biogenesis protein CcmI
MNEQLVLIAIGLVAAAFILRPLIRGRRSGSPTGERPAVPPDVPASTEELAELELDRAMGRVSEEDYVRWRSELEATAAAADTAVPVTPALAPEPDDAVARAEALVRRWREAPRPSCPTCGERPEPGARYCSSCGTSLAS